MVRGGAHLHSFYVPFNPDEIHDIYITYSQKDRTIIEKSTKDCVYNEEKKCIQTQLSQADTLSFLAPGISATAEGSLVIIQIRLILNDNIPYVSHPIKERLYDVIKGGTI